MLPVTEGHPMLLEMTLLSNGVTLKSGLEVTKGHWKWHHSIDGHPSEY